MDHLQTHSLFFPSLSVTHTDSLNVTTLKAWALHFPSTHTFLFSGFKVAEIFPRSLTVTHSASSRLFVHGLWNNTGVLRSDAAIFRTIFCLSVLTRLLQITVSGLDEKQDLARFREWLWLEFKKGLGEGLGKHPCLDYRLGELYHHSYSGNRTVKGYNIKNTDFRWKRETNSLLCWGLLFCWPILPPRRPPGADCRCSTTSPLLQS